MLMKRQSGRPGFSLQLYHRDAGTAELHVLVAVGRDIGYGREVLPYHLPEDAVALSVKDANLRRTHENGVVDEVLHLCEGLVGTHPAHVYFLSEMAAVLVDGLARLPTVVESLKLLLLALQRGSVDMLEPPYLHLRADGSEDDYRLLALKRFYPAYGGQALDAHVVAHPDETFRPLLFGCGTQLFSGSLLPVCLVALVQLVAFLAAAYLVNLLLEVLIAKESGRVEGLFVRLASLAGLIPLAGQAVFAHQPGLVGSQFLPYPLRLLFLRLLLAYLADGVFYPSVALADDFLSLPLGLGNDFPAALPEFGYLLLIACEGLFEFLFLPVYGLAFASQ